MDVEAKGGQSLCAPMGVSILQGKNVQRLVNCH